MKDEPEIVKILREEEKLGKLRSQPLHTYEEITIVEESPEDDGKNNDSFRYAAQNITPATKANDLKEIYQTVFENSAVAITLTDEKERIISWNKYAELLLGVTREDLFMKPVKSLYPLEEWKKIRSENVRQKGMQHHLETKMIRKNNAPLDIDISLSVLKNSNGNVIGSIGIIKDITQRKQMERALKESEEKFKQLYEKAPIPYHTLSPTGEITNVSDKWCQILGYKKTEIIGRSIFDLIAEEEREAAKVSFKEKIRSKRTYTGGNERTYIMRGGEKRIFVIHDFFSFDESNNVKSVHTTMEDITERKQIEEKLKNSEKRFRDISYSMADWIWEVDKNGRYTFASGTVEEVLGYKAEELIGKTPFDLMPEDEAKRAGQIFEKIASKKKPIVDLENWNITKNGKRVCVLTTGVPISDENGELIGYRGVDKNITERKKAEEALQLTNQELTILKEELSKLNKGLERKVKERTAEVEKLLRQKDEFISQLGHDLKTPLSVILNVLPMIKAETQDKDLQHDCDIAIRNSNYISSLVTETLKIAELSSPNVKFNIETLPLHDIVREAVSDKQPVFKEKDIIVNNNIDKSLMVNGDKLRLGELLNNILTNAVNAVKFTANGGNIIFDAKKENDIVTVSVTDTGIGLTNKQIDHIFDEFYKADRSRHEINSCGLGLSICKRIVEKHGGRIWAESPGIGKGTTITFTLTCKKRKRDRKDN